MEPDNATNKGVSWATNNEKVATVDNGRIEAVGPGEAVITVTTEDGGFTATCKVKVTRDGANSVAIDPASLTMTSGDIRTIWVNFDDVLRDYQTVVISIEPEIATATPGLIAGDYLTYDITAHDKGTATLTASTEAANGETITATCDITINAPDDTQEQQEQEQQEQQDPIEEDQTQNEQGREKDNNNSKTGGGGGGCNAGFLGLAALAALTMKKR